MSDQKTHREVKHPQISIRYLADYMSASEQARRTIIRGCKYQPIARVVQHDEAKLAVSKFICSSLTDIATLQSEAQRLRDRMADSEFDRDVLDHNVDYIERFVQVSSKLELPNAEILPPGKSSSVSLSWNESHVRSSFSASPNHENEQNPSWRGNVAIRQRQASTVGSWRMAIRALVWAAQPTRNGR